MFRVYSTTNIVFKEVPVALYNRNGEGSCHPSALSNGNEVGNVILKMKLGEGNPPSSLLLIPTQMGEGPFPICILLY